MAHVKESPYICHIFVCTNDRQGARKSCADGKSIEIRAILKEEITNRGWKPRVRVSQSGCLGVCEDGPNVMLYPQKIWFSGVAKNDVSIILEQVKEIIEKQSAKT